MVRDREAWCVAVHGVAKNWTWLSNWTDWATLTPFHFHAKHCSVKIRTLEPRATWAFISFVTRQFGLIYLTWILALVRDLSSIQMIENLVSRFHKRVRFFSVPIFSEPPVMSITFWCNGNSIMKIFSSLLLLWKDFLRFCFYLYSPNSNDPLKNSCK